MERGRFNASEEMTLDRLWLVLERMAVVTDESAAQLQTLTDFTVEDRFTPVPHGGVPLSMPARIDFDMLIATLMDVFEYGMEGAP